MDMPTLFVILGVIIAILHFAWDVLKKDEQSKEAIKRLRELIRQNKRSLRKIYLFAAITSSVYIIYMFVLSFTIQSSVLGIAIIDAILFWALLSFWIPIKNRKKLNIAFDILGYLVGIFALVGLWIIRWPEWQQLIMITLLPLALIIFIIFNRITASRKQGEISSKD